MKQDKLKLLDTLFAEQIAQEKIKGASLLLERKGRREFQNTYGSDRKDSIYKIYSMTKPIVTVAFLQLYEKGLVDLMEPVGTYLPAYSCMQVASGQGLQEQERPVLIQDLLNMTSGIVYPAKDTEPERCMERLFDEYCTRNKGKKVSNLELINEAARVPLLFQPGERWFYGFSADVLGGIIEVISNVSLGEYLRKNIFEPLEMEETGFYVKKDQIERLSPMYYRTQDHGKLRIAESEETTFLNFNLEGPCNPPIFESGGAGLYSTLEDYSHFAGMLLNNGSYHGREILGRKTVAFLSTNQLNTSQLSSIYFDSIVGYGYGNLMRIMMDPCMTGSNGSVGEYGWDGMPGTYFFIDPREEMIFVYMQQIQQGADQSLRRKMRQIIYGSIV